MGTMIALHLGDKPELLELASQLPEEIRTSPDSYHVTLCYVPNGDAIDISGLIEYPTKFDLMVAGVRLFPVGNDGFPIVLLIDKTPELQALHDALCERADGKVSEYSYEKFTPHITLGYTPTPNITLPSFAPFVLTCDNVVQVGDDEMIKQYQHGAGGLLSESGEVESKPYSGADDPAVPDNVPDDKRERWVQIFNQVLEDTQDEGRAFAVANAYLKRNSKSFFDSIYSWFAGTQELDMQKDYGFKLLDDNTFIGWYSNAYKDREGEILARAGFEADIEFMEANDAYPDLCFWHIRGAVWGKAKAVALIGRFVVAVGEIYDTKLAKALKSAVQSEQSWGMSHGFVYNPSSFTDSIYNEFHTFEISVLPLEEAANLLTGFGIGEEIMPQVNPKAIDALEKALVGTGIDVNSLIAAGLEQTAKADQTFDFKSLSKTFKETMMAVEPDGAKMEVETGVDLVSIIERIAGLENMMGEVLTRLAPVEEAAMDEEKPTEQPAPEQPEKVEDVVEVRALRGDIQNLTKSIKELFTINQSTAQSVQQRAFGGILDDYQNNGLPADDANPLPTFSNTVDMFASKMFRQNGGAK